jgi:multicomponent Na+:H+ antiporter subunit C
METLLPLVVGSLFASGFYLMLSRSLLRLVLGFLVLSQAANLLLFASGGLRKGSLPIISEGGSTLTAGPEPLTQALILTAIVIGFAATAFLVALAWACFKDIRTSDTDEMREAER